MEGGRRVVRGACGIPHAPTTVGSGPPRTRSRRVRLITSGIDRSADDTGDGPCVPATPDHPSGGERPA
jgi:hypothetical protein